MTTIDARKIGEVMPACTETAEAGLIHDETLSGDELYDLIAGQEAGVSFDMGEFVLSDKQIADGGDGYFNCIDSLQNRLGVRNQDVTFVIAELEGKMIATVKVRNED